MSDGVGPPTTGGRRRRALGLAVAVGLAGLDQLTKIWAVAALSDGPVPVIGDTVVLRLARNPGGAFGRFQGMTPVLAVLAAGVAIYLVRATRHAADRVTVAALVMVLGGALGNLTDRVARSPGFLRGHVVDFVSVGWWPVFNLADSCISIGALLLVWRGWRAEARPAGGVPLAEPTDGPGLRAPKG